MNIETASELYKTLMVSNMNPKLLLVELKQPLPFLFFPLLSLEEVLPWVSAFPCLAQEMVESWCEVPSLLS